MSATRSYDAIVLGLGAVGSATLFHLARRGVRVLGLEQYEQGHTLGSSHGESRIIRETYFEHPLYVPLVRRAHELWRELEKAAGRSLMTMNGGLMIGPRDGYVITGTLRSAREYDLPHEILSAEEVGRRFPAFELESALVAVYDPRAGYLDADACNRAHIDAAVANGATVRFADPVLEWAASADGVTVRTSTGPYSAATLALTAGGWNASLLRELGLPLVVERQSIFWLEPTGESAYEPDRFPIYAYEYKPGHICYGFPRLRKGVKASVMHSGELARRPEEVRRAVDDDEIEPLRAALRPVLPGLSAAAVRESGTCVFTNTPDHDFIIDWHPAKANVLISSPCSGHGFKFASVVGELQAELLTDRRTKFDLSPFRLDRFAV
ncbi:MAG TPA: N-methyl-L-tryptophan oxidase [Gemmatimonadaceae bacterium]